MLAVNRLGRKSSVMLLLAGCRSAAFIIGAFFLPVYQSAAGPAGHADSGPDTLAGVDGQGAVAIIAAPLLAVLVAGIALRLSPRRIAVVIARVTAKTLVVLNLLAMPSVGP